MTDLEIFAFYGVPAIVVALCGVGALIVRSMPRPPIDGQSHQSRNGETNLEGVFKGLRNGSPNRGPRRAA